MPWKPGESGNPAGSQTSKPWRDAINRAVARAQHDDDYRSLNKLAEKLLEKASEGDMAALKELGDRLDGRPAQTIEGNPEAPLSVSGTLVVTGVRPAG
jgi:hypothetical protein